MISKPPKINWFKVVLAIYPLGLLLEFECRLMFAKVFQIRQILLSITNSLSLRSCKNNWLMYVGKLWDTIIKHSMMLLCIHFVGDWEVRRVNFNKKIALCWLCLFLKLRCYKINLSIQLNSRLFILIFTLYLIFSLT